MNPHAKAIRRSMTDPHRVVKALRLEQGAVRQSGGYLIRCPAHVDRTPSCSVTRGPDGTLRVKCFGCELSGDVLTLVGAVTGLSLRRNFKDVMLACCDAGGLHQLRDAICSRSEAPPFDFQEPPATEEPRDYPPQPEVEQTWSTGYAPECIEMAHTMLAMRGLAPDAGLARAIGDETELAWWASYRSPERREAGLPRQSWRETGHLVILPVYNCFGVMRSLRSWQCRTGYEGPKRLPAAGHRSNELVLANDAALAILREPGSPKRILIEEGEGDYLAMCQAYPGIPVLGVMNGSWSDAFARRIPMGSLVMVRTHQDEAGERYAQAIIRSIKDRAVVRRVV